MLIINNVEIHSLSDLIPHMRTMTATDFEKAVDDMMENKEEFNQLILNFYYFSLTLKILPANVADKIMSYLLTDIHLFEKIFDTHIVVSDAIRELPASYHDAILKVTCESDKQFQRLISNKYKLQALITNLPQYLATRVMTKIINSPEEIERFLTDFDMLIFFTKTLSINELTQLINYLVNNELLFKRIINNEFAIQRVLKELPEKCAALIVGKYDTTYKESALHIAARFKPEFLPIAFRLGSHVTLADRHGNNSLYYLLNHEKFNFEHAILMIEQGADPNTKSRDGFTCLHKIVESKVANQLVPVLIKLGADIHIPYQKQTPLKWLLDKTNFTLGDIDPALALIQHGADASTRNKRNFNILQIIYKAFESIEKNVYTLNISSADKINPDMVFKKIKIPALRIQVQQLLEKSIAQKNYLDFILWLAYGKEISKSQDKEKHLLFTLPANVLAKIINYLDFDFDAMGKTVSEGLQLAEYVFANSHLLPTFQQRPGGISVMQQKGQDKKYQFTLFSSAKTLSQDFDAYKTQLKYTQKRRNPLLDKIRNLEFTNTSTHGIAEFRQHALNVFNEHISLFKKTSSKLALIESIEDTDLYQPIKNLLQ